MRENPFTYNATTVLTDGDAGLREVQKVVVPGATHVLDWFHLAMRFQNLSQGLKSPMGPEGDDARQHAIKELERAKWAFWHGKTNSGLVRLTTLSKWAQTPFLQTTKPIARLATALPDLLRYVELNRDSMPNYSQRYRANERIATSFAESSVNEIISQRMSKRQQMRWNRHTVEGFLRVRVHALNGTIDQAFRQIYRGFRPTPDPQPAAAHG